ncbi:uncharacterized protein LOC112167596 [Rosa chinensis]|uniref:uncharacterized protein LOC112167596 n=1 Tax=Rosa chinensis TaxID=74649 RepID=UPI000D08C55B|nr:uncharacterized protein LOC112167596 [Rosa chinensis]
MADVVLIWLDKCVQQLPLTQLGELLFSLWGIWKERNDRIWNQKQRVAGDVSVGLVSRLQEFRFHNLLPSGPRRQLRVVWRAPPVGLVKINVDGSFHHVTRKGGLGFVVRDANGIMLGGGASQLIGLISLEHAEILACKATLEFALQHGFGPAILETDAMKVQRQLSSEVSANTSLLGRLYDDVMALGAAQGVLHVSHVGRQGNMVAHVLANHACSLRQAGFFFSVPVLLQAAIAADVCTV